MDRYEYEMQSDDEQSAAVVKTMVIAVVGMALSMMATVLMISTGGSVLV